jgi:recombination associated protein RdgC
MRAFFPMAMWFRNLLVFRVSPGWNIAADDFEERLAAAAIQPCGRFSTESRGWVYPRNEERHLYNLNRQWLIGLGVDQKILPASVVRQAVDERAAALAKKQDHPVGRKQKRDLREQIIEELLPRALVRRRITRAWIDTVNGFLAVDSPADKKADELMEILHKTHDKLPGLTLLNTEVAPGSAMTRWLASGKPPAQFSIDQDLELQSPQDSRSAIRYVRHSLEGREIRDHLSTGMTVTKLGMTWKDRISFVLTDKLQVKRVTFLEVIKEESTDQSQDEAEQYDLDFALMTGELAALVTDLVEALGGEKPSERVATRRPEAD